MVRLDRRFAPLALLVMMAGCASPGDPPLAGQATGVDAQDPVAAPTPGARIPWTDGVVDEPQRLTWDGYLRLGAIGETAAHLSPSGDVTDGFWRAGFVIEIAEAPDVLELSLNWSSTGPTNIYFVAHAPDGARRPNESGFAQYDTHGMKDMLNGQGGAETGPLCMSIPRADLLDDLARISKDGPPTGRARYWYLMAHSHAGAEIQLHFTVTSLGGAISMPDAPHRYDTNPETLQKVVQTLFVSPDRPWDSCTLLA